MGIGMGKRLGGILGVLVMLLALGMTVCAAEAGDTDIKKNRVFQTAGEVELHEQPDTASAVTAVLPAGTPVIVQEDAEDGWCKAAYRDETGYVQTAFLGMIGGQSVPDAAVSQDGTANDTAPDSGMTVGADETEAVPVAVMQKEETLENDGTAVPENADTLDDEFQRMRDANLRSYQEAAAAKEQTAAKTAWGIAIAVLVIAIFAVGITTTLAGSKRKKKS